MVLHVCGRRPESFQNCRRPSGALLLCILYGTQPLPLRHEGRKSEPDPVPEGHQPSVYPGLPVTSLSPIPLLSLAGCAICGFSVGLMWPGTFSLGATYLRGGGTFMYAMFALAGDVGCSAGPGVVGIISQFTGKMNLGILTAILFPVGMLILVSLLNRQKPA